MTTDRAGMLMPSASVSVANTTFTRPAGERLLDRLLHRRHHPRVVGGEARLEPGEPLVVARARRGRRRRGRRSWRRRSRGCGPVRAGSVRRSPAARHCSTAWSQPLRLKMNAIAGSIASAASSSTVSTRLGVRSRVRGRPAPAGVAGVAGVEAGGVGVGAQLAVGPGDERRQQVELVGAPLPDEVEVLELDRAVLLDDRRGARRAPSRSRPRPPRRSTPSPRGTRGHLGREVDDDLLPHRPAVAVLEVVHLVEHDVAQALERGRRRVDHVAQHLGGHHHDRCVAVDRVVAGEQTDACAAVARGRGRRTSGSTAPSAAWCRRPCRPRRARASIAYSATSVLPEPVGAATSTLSPASSASSASPLELVEREPAPGFEGWPARATRPAQGVEVVGRRAWCGDRGGGRAGDGGRRAAGHGRRGRDRGGHRRADPSRGSGRRNHTSAAVTTITASDASTAMTTSRRSRGGFHAGPASAALALGAHARSVSSLQDPPDDDRSLVEDVHGDGHREQRVRVLARA